MNYIFPFENVSELATVTAEQCTNMCRQIVFSGYNYYIFAILVCSGIGMVYTIYKIKNKKEHNFFLFLFLMILILLYFLTRQLQNITQNIYYG